MSDLAARLSDLDAYIEAEMQKWHVPGMAVGREVVSTLDEPKLGFGVI